MDIWAEFCGLIIWHDLLSSLSQGWREENYYLGYLYDSMAWLSLSTCVALINVLLNCDGAAETTIYSLDSYPSLKISDPAATVSAVVSTVAERLGVSPRAINLCDEDGTVIDDEVGFEGVGRSAVVFRRYQLPQYVYNPTHLPYWGADNIGGLADYYKSRREALNKGFSEGFEGLDPASQAP